MAEAEPRELYEITRDSLLILAERQELYNDTITDQQNKKIILDTLHTFIDNLPTDITPLQRLHAFSKRLVEGNYVKDCGQMTYREAIAKFMPNDDFSAAVYDEQYSLFIVRCTDVEIAMPRRTPAPDTLQAVKKAFRDIYRDPLHRDDLYERVLEKRRTDMDPLKGNLIPFVSMRIGNLFQKVFYFIIHYFY